jgi:mono/diheme cytochrome c family protein
MLKKALACGAIVCVIGGYAFGSAKGADLAKGKTLYTSKCVLCHGAQGQGNGPASMALRPKPANFAGNIVWQTPGIEKTMANVIKSGKGQMQAFPDLSTNDIQDILQYIEQTFKPK